MNQQTNFFYIAIFLMIIFILFMVYLFGTVRPFVRSRRYIKMEMARSTKEENIHWQKEMKRAYVALIPIFGNRLKQKVK